MKSEAQRNEPVFWLDQILGGGFMLPSLDGPPRALTVLLTGPPGTGKSTLALELCYRWSLDSEIVRIARPWRTLYLTSEAHAPWMRSNAKALGWTQIDSHLVTEPRRWAHGTILVLNSGDAEGFRTTLSRLQRIPKRSATEGIRKFWQQLPNLFFSEVRREKGHQAFSNRRTKEKHALPVPDVLVIDSLNTLPKQDDQVALFQHFMKLVGGGPRVLICVLNSTAGHASTNFWEFAADVVLRLDRYEESGYLIRTIEVAKARYQEHAFGKHQLKTYKQEEVLDHKQEQAIADEFRETFATLTHSPCELQTNKSQLEAYASQASKLMRAHPFRTRTEGGLVIFPSIHYVLSRYKRASPTKPDRPIPSGVPGLAKLLHNGYPSGRCTAFVGGRGGHKSHLAYVELLHRLIHDPHEKALVVSLRDDEGLTRGTMESILRNRWPEMRDSKKLQDPEVQLLRWEAQGRLELTYYPPGYITPEEFFHRLMLSIHRLKATNTATTHVTLVFNSLDQLSSRFPLCVNEEVFIPGIIQMLSGEGISSFFVAARETLGDHSPERAETYYYGLQTMAELILDFERCLMPRDEVLRYAKHAMKIGEEKLSQLRLRYPDTHDAVVVTVVRHAGGQAAGAKAMLELLEEENPLQQVSEERDLVALPFLIENLHG